MHEVGPTESSCASGQLLSVPETISEFRPLRHSAPAADSGSLLRSMKPEPFGRIAIRRVGEKDRSEIRPDRTPLGRCNCANEEISFSAFGVIALISFWLPSPPRRERVVLALVVGEKGWG